MKIKIYTFLREKLQFFWIFWGASPRSCGYTQFRRRGAFIPALTRLLCKQVRSGTATPLLLSGAIFCQKKARAPPVEPPGGNLWSVPYNRKKTKKYPAKTSVFGWKAEFSPDRNGAKRSKGLFYKKLCCIWCTIYRTHKFGK